ncbi:hypothetical protein H5410_045748 [Solanum commersonii]|uniref:Uncharacterized protein n=1 Tax=Solanum commersonii TaxID=4109 RepID=A0A9J5XC42_SOLCO|nr:hypothetical protein H5410_045748 [Solanum commersonii]
MGVHKKRRMKMVGGFKEDREEWNRNKIIWLGQRGKAQDKGQGCPNLGKHCLNFTSTTMASDEDQGSWVVHGAWAITLYGLPQSGSPSRTTSRRVVLTPARGKAREGALALWEASP